MKRYSISALAAECGLSRSTLLYYDRIGVLPPSGRTGAQYRFYTERDRLRLEQIGHYRQAGLTLREIRAVFASGGKPGAELLRKRIGQTAREMLRMRTRQHILAGMLKRVSVGKTPDPINKRMWIELLRAAGMDETAMFRWHREFEKRSPDGHHEFLAWLGISKPEILKIRKWATEGREPGK